MDSNNVFSSGSKFSLNLTQKDPHDPLLLNNSIQNWTYTHLNHGYGSEGAAQNFLLNTSYSSSDHTKGRYEDLILLSTHNHSPKKDFTLSSKIKKQIFEGKFKLNFFEELHFRVVFLILFFIIFPSFVFFLQKVKLKVNFGYFSASLLTFLQSLYCKYFLDLQGVFFQMIVLIQYTNVFMILGGNKIFPDKETICGDLKELWRKKGALMIASEVILILLTLNLNYFLMALFLPLLMAWVDRLQSLGCYSVPILMFNELSKYAIMFIGCYIPSYLLEFENTLLMGFNYQNLSIYLVTGFILIPGLFLVQACFTKKSVKKAKLVLVGKELHGRRRDLPMLIQKGQGDIISTRQWNILFDPFPHRPDRFAFYHPKSFLGVLELELQQDPRFRTGVINFYTYRRRLNPLAAQLPQRCQDLGYKPSIRFQILKKQPIGREIYHLYIIPVEVSEASDSQRLVVLIMELYGKSTTLSHSF